MKSAQGFREQARRAMHHRGLNNDVNDEDTDGRNGGTYAASLTQNHAEGGQPLCVLFVGSATPGTCS